MKDLMIIIDELFYKKICYNKINKYDIKIDINDGLNGKLDIYYNGRSFTISSYKTLNIILRSIIRGSYND